MYVGDSRVHRLDETPHTSTIKAGSRLELSEELSLRAPINAAMNGQDPTALGAGMLNIFEVADGVWDDDSKYGVDQEKTCHPAASAITLDHFHKYLSWRHNILGGFAILVLGRSGGHLMAARALHESRMTLEERHRYDVCVQSRLLIAVRWRNAVGQSMVMDGPVSAAYGLRCSVLGRWGTWRVGSDRHGVYRRRSELVEQ